MLMFASDAISFRYLTQRYARYRPSSAAPRARGQSSPPRLRSTSARRRASRASRSSWISSGGIHDSGSISFASSRASQRASSRSVFALRSRPSRPRACTGSARRTSTQRDEFAPDPAPAGRGLDRQRFNSAPPALRPTSKALPIRREALLDHLTTDRDRARPPETRAYGCRSPRTT
jgi:hypothetical protein